MNHKALLAGAVVALVGVALLFLYMQRYEREASGGTPVSILMVRQDFALGEPISVEGLAVRELPEAYLEDRHIRVEDQDRIVGIRTAHGLRANQALLWTDLATALEARRELSGLLRRGMRAVTLTVDRSDAIISLLQPGDRVDLLYTGFRSGETDDDNRRVTISLLQNVMILAIGTYTGGDTDDTQGRRQKQDVSLAVTLEQAALITHATTEGDIELTLRNSQDIALVDDLEDVTNEDLIEPAQRQRIQRRRRAPQQENIEHVGHR